MPAQDSEHAKHYVELLPGDPAPDFTQKSTSNPKFHFNTAGGRYIVLCFFGSSRNPYGSRALTILSQDRQLFDDHKIAFFGISIDPADEHEQRVRESLPGIRFFWDMDGTISRLYGALPAEETTAQE